MIPGRTRKPHLTRKVVEGLTAMAAAIGAGDMLEGDLADDRDAVVAAMRWIADTSRWKRAREWGWG